MRDATTNEDGQITDEGINFNFGYPGAIKDKQTFVKNTSENDLYTRIAVTKYWEDESGNKVIDANPGFIEIITNDKIIGLFKIVMKIKKLFISIIKNY